LSPVGPSEVSEDVARSAGIAARKRPLVEFTARSTYSRVSYRPYRFSDPAAPFALASALRSSDTRSVSQPFNQPTTPLVEFRAPAESCPTSPSRSPRRPSPSRIQNHSPGRNRNYGPDRSQHRRRQPRSAPLLDFAALQHFRIRRSTCRAASEPRCVPPPGFGYPLDGFLPPSPCRLCFTPTALVGLAPSESSPFERYRARLQADAPTYRFLPPLRSSLSRRAGPAGRGSWALTLPKVPRDRRRLSPPTRRLLPWGFSLPGCSRKGLDPHFDGPPLSRLPSRPSRPAEADHRRRPDASQRLTQPPPGPNRPKGKPLVRFEQPS